MKSKNRFYLKVLACLIVILSLIAFSAIFLPKVSAQNKSCPNYERVNAIFISDKITEVAYRLGVVPVAYCARCCWPMVQKELSTIKRLGCYRCATLDSVVKAAEKHKIRFALVEFGSPTIYKKNWNWYKKFGEPLKEKGYDVHRIDFSKGVPQTILEIGKLLGKEKKAKELAKQYTEHLKMTKSKIPAAKANKKILVLKGVGKRGIQVEVPGGYTDIFLLGPLGCVNVGDLVKSGDTEVKKGHFMLEDWQRVAKANPDIIVKCGNPYPIEKGLVRALKKYQELSEVSAIKNHAIYTLPAYFDSSVTQYPSVLGTWIDAICR